MRIAVFNQKGGVGKTTTSLNLAAAHANRGMTSLLIDLDPQAHLTSVHGVQNLASGASAFSHYKDGRPLAELIIEWPRIGWLLPAHAELIKVDSLFGKGPQVIGRLKSGLARLFEGNHPVAQAASLTLIDCCPFLGVLSLNAIMASDAVLVPVSSDHLSLRGAQQIDHTLKALEPVLKRRIPRRYVLTRFDRRRRMCFDIQEKIVALFGTDVCATVISENVSLAEAPAIQKDIFSHAAQSKGAQDYTALLAELQDGGFLTKNP